MQVFTAPVVGEEVVGKSVKENDDDLVPLNQCLKRSRPSASKVVTDSPVLDVGESTLGAPAAAARPPRSGHKRLKMGLSLRSTAASARLVLWLCCLSVVLAYFTLLVLI